VPLQHHRGEQLGGRQALESDYTAMADSGMLRGEFPNFPELLARISQLEEQCNAIARSLS
jgi:hypothetical protein